MDSLVQLMPLWFNWWFRGIRVSRSWCSTHFNTTHTQTRHRHFSWLANGYPIFSLIPAPDKHIPRILHTVYVCSLLNQAICSNFPCPEAVLAAPSLSSHSNERQSSRRSTTHYCNAVTCQITTFPQLLRASAIQQRQGVRRIGCCKHKRRNNMITLCGF